ncbi:uncharacterized protein LOC135367133 isoform X2 [Ornithodoros turicata]|uniref:uncharacterized protein LOC135367133 isoform X2 n=1 Tax=Ornithodoros turicata TaxID=34597 RepID=UPI00313A38E1
MTEDTKKFVSDPATTNSDWTILIKKFGTCICPALYGNDCFGYALPLYLAPFLFGNIDSRCMYCILVTIMSMMGSHLPRTISAFFPVVLLPLSGVMSSNRLALYYIDVTKFSPNVSLITDRSRTAQEECSDWMPYQPTGPSLIKQFKVYKAEEEERGPATIPPQSDVENTKSRVSDQRKTCFNHLPASSRPRSSHGPHLPVRRIPSLSEPEKRRISSILKECKMKDPECELLEATVLKDSTQTTDNTRPRKTSSIRIAGTPVPKKASVTRIHDTTVTTSRVEKTTSPTQDEIRRPSILKNRSLSMRSTSHVVNAPPWLLTTDTPTYLIQESGRRMFLPASPPCETSSTASPTFKQFETSKDGRDGTDGNSDWKPGSNPGVRKFIGFCSGMRTAFLLGATMTSVIGSLASFWNIPARSAITLHLGKYRQQVTAWTWFSVTLPTAAIVAVVWWAIVYVFYIVAIEDGKDYEYEKIMQEVTKSIKNRLRDTRERRFQETLISYWFLVIPFYYATYLSRNVGQAYIESSVFSLSMIVMMMLPRDNWRPWAARRFASWNSIKERVPWNLIVMYGSVSSLTKLAEEHNLVKVLFDHVGAKFWGKTSARTNQFVLTVVAAVLSEIMGNHTLNDLIVPIVIEIAVESKTPPVFYVIPVGVAASANVIMPVSLPLLILRESLQISCSRMIATGLILKVVLVLTILVSMNTLGTHVFRGAEIPEEVKSMFDTTIARRLLNVTPPSVNMSRMYS